MRIKQVFVVWQPWMDFVGDNERLLRSLLDFP